MMKRVWQWLKGQDVVGIERFYRWMVAVFVVYYSVGVVLVGGGFNVPAQGFSDFLFILFAAALVFLREWTAFGGRRTWVLFAWVAVISGTVETVGTLTGVPFGAYYYTEAFGPRLAGVLPLAIPLAWWLVVMPVYRLLQGRGGPPRWLFIPICAALVTAIDFVIEPMAVGLKGYWIWEDGGVYYDVPWSNFGGWFLTGALITGGLLLIESRFGMMRGGSITDRAKVIAPQPVRVAHYAVITAVLVFFIAALATSSLWPPVILGWALIARGGLLLNDQGKLVWSPGSRRSR